MSGTPHSMFERRVHALIAGAVLLAVAAVLTLLIAEDPFDPATQSLDDRWMAWMADVHRPWLTDLANVLNVLGEPLVMVPLRLGVLGALVWQRRWLAFAAFAAATVTSELFIGPLKAALDRPRPIGALIEADSASFPSGHAIAASVTAIGIVIVLVPAAGRRARWTVVAALFAALMAMSRTYLAAHWASDVVAGVCIGTGLAVAWPAALELWAGRHRNHATDRTAAALRVGSVGLLAIGISCVAVLHLLRPDLEAADHRISEYALGRWGAVMAVGFVSIGLGVLVLARLLARAGGPWSRLVPAVLAIAGIGMVVSAIFGTDPERSGAAADTVHSLASAIATMALIVAALLWTFGRGGLTEARRRPVAAGLALLTAVLGAISPLLHRSSLTGLSQRLLWLCLLVWLVMTAWQNRPVWTPPDRGATRPKVNGDRSERAHRSPSDRHSAMP
jgi:membrane-associated phospholipid phosphatase